MFDFQNKATCELFLEEKLEEAKSTSADTETNKQLNE